MCYITRVLFQNPSGNWKKKIQIEKHLSPWLNFTCLTHKQLGSRGFL